MDTGGRKTASPPLPESNSLSPGSARQTPDLQPVTAPGLNTIYFAKGKRKTNKQTKNLLFFKQQLLGSCLKLWKDKCSSFVDSVTGKDEEQLLHIHTHARTGSYPGPSGAAPGRKHPAAAAQVEP